MVARNLTNFRRAAEYTTREGMRLYVPPSSAVDLASIPGEVDPFAETTTQQFPLGSRLEYADRIFRYGENGAVALAAGKLVQSVVPAAGEIDEVLENGVVIGDTGITFTQTTGGALAADLFQDGYLNIRDETGEGYLYRIKTHPSLTDAAAVEVTLYDPILIVPADAATGDLIRHPFKAVIIHPSPNTARIVGCPVMAVAANKFAWFQTRGPCSVLCDQTVVIGQHVRCSDAAVDGSVEPLDRDGVAEDEQELGVVIMAAADTEYSIIHLTLE